MTRDVRSFVLALALVGTYGCGPAEDAADVGVGASDQALSGTFRLQAVHSNRCLDVAGASTANGTSVLQWDCHTGGNQQWRVEQQPNGSHQLVAVHSGKCLDIYAASPNDGAKGIQWSCGGGNNQRFWINDKGNGYELMAVHSGKCLDIEAWGTHNGAKLQQWACHGGANQRFRLLATQAPPPPPPPSSTRRVVGYLPEYRGIGAYTPKLASAGLTHVNLAFANPASGVTPALDAPEGDIASFVNAAHAAGTKVLISIGGGEESDDIAPLLSSGNRTAFADALVSYIVSRNMDGLDIDIEGSHANTADYAPFVVAVSSKLKAQQKLLTGAFATWYLSGVSGTALAEFDFINVMSYDKCGPWTGACEQATYDAAVADLNAFAARGIASGKLVLGVPFYAWCWGSGCPAGNAYTYAGLLQAYPNAWQQDFIQQDGRSISYNGQNTILRKVGLAKGYGGMMAWELGQDASGSQSLLATIKNNL